MNITCIEAISKGKRKVYIDEMYAFTLYYKEIQKFHLEEGCEITSETVSSIEKDILLPRGKNRALYLIEYKERTVSQMKQQLEKEGYPQRVSDEIVAFLQKYHYLDDDAYIRRYLEVYHKKRSIRQMQYELQLKGLVPEQITNVVEEMNLEDCTGLEGLVAKRLKGKTLDERELSKQYAYFMRKGYQYSDIQGAIRAYQNL
ncbi:MAG: regulatory protein RecX [Lachnospiraceae bacterium]